MSVEEQEGIMTSDLP